MLRNNHAPSAILIPSGPRCRCDPICSTTLEVAISFAALDDRSSRVSFCFGRPMEAGPLTLTVVTRGACPPDAVAPDDSGAARINRPLSAAAEVSVLKSTSWNLVNVRGDLRFALDLKDTAR